MNKRPLHFYVTGCVIVWALVLYGIWLWGAPHFITAVAVCCGFFIGQFAMYIAVHIYKWQ